MLRKLPEEPAFVHSCAAIRDVDVRHAPCIATEHAGRDESSPVEDAVMERNPNEGNQSGQSGSGTSGYGASSGAGGSGSVGGESYGSAGSTGGSTGASGTTGSGTGGSYGSSGTGGSYGSTGTAESKTQQARDAAGDKLNDAKSAATDKLGKAKEKAGELKASLADKLEAGAEKLRSRNQSGSYAGSTGSGSAAIASDDRMAEVSNKVAGGLQASADWIREADLDSMKTGIETQVKEHPGRTLLIAAGIGYLLGKAFRR
jgi:hypothetical protein